MAKKHGNVYSIRFGQRRVVVLNGFEAVKEGLATQGDSTVDRPYFPLHEEVGNGLGEKTEQILFSILQCSRKKKRLSGSV